MMFSCERATELISTSLDSKLSLYKSIGLKVHLWMCKLCSRCWQQMLFLRNTMLKCAERVDEINFMPDHSLSEEACERIKNSLRKHDLH